ncbi:MAG: serine hydrolase [Pseudomonadota bacterium]
MVRTLIIGLVALCLGAGIGVFGYTRIVPLPHDAIARGQAFEGDRDYFFQSASELYPTRRVAHRLDAVPLPERANALEGFTFSHGGVSKTLQDLFVDMETSGLVILHRGEIVFEQYARGADAGTLLTTWSVVKSITSTLVGVAIQDGFIGSVDEPLIQYLPELRGTAYDGVTIKQALQMSSGIRYDPNLYDGDMSDTVQVLTNSVVTGKHPTFDLAIKFPRENAPGTKFNYNTAESQVLIELVRRATGMDAAQYLEQKIWQPVGMVQDAAWILDNSGRDGAEIGGAMFNAALRDWARFGLFISRDGTWDGQQILPSDWVARATVSDEAHLKPGQVHPNPVRGYAWHWWTYADGTFVASGANGQSIYVDRANDLVVARASAWPEGYVRAHDELTSSFYRGLADWAQAQEGR